LEIHEFYKRIENYDLNALYENKDYINLAFVLGFMDYICNMRSLLRKPQNFIKFENFKLEEPWYQKGMDIYISVTRDCDFKKEFYDKAIPEFKKRNVIIVDVDEAV